MRPLLTFCPHTAEQDGRRRRYIVFHVGHYGVLKSGCTDLEIPLRQRLERTGKMPVQRKRQSALRASAHSRVRVRMFDAVAVVAGRVRVVDKGASLSPVRREIFQPDDYIRRAVRVEIPFELQRA